MRKYFEKSWHSCWIFQSQAINLINQREKPLALYVFSEHKEVKRPSRNKKGKIFQPTWQRCKNGSSSAPQVEGSWSMTHSCISGYHLWYFTWSYFVFSISPTVGGCELGGLRSSSPSQGQVHRGAALDLTRGTWAEVARGAHPLTPLKSPESSPPRCNQGGLGLDEGDLSWSCTRCSPTDSAQFPWVQVWTWTLLIN